MKEANSIGLLVVGGLATLWLLSQVATKPKSAFTPASLPKSEKEKTPDEVARSLATVEVLPAPGVTESDVDELNKKGSTYLEILVDFMKRSGVADPQADIRSVKVLKPTVGRIFVAGSKRYRFSAKDRLLAVSTLTRGEVYFVLAVSKPSDWPFGDWAFGYYPLFLGSQIRTAAGTRDPAVAVPLTTTAF